MSKKHLDYAQGLLGEKIVTQKLMELDDNYYLINDILLDPIYGNIDHILLGPNGIFIIETKNWIGTFVFKGDDLFRRHGEIKSTDYLIESISKRVKVNAAKLSQNIEAHLFNNSLKIWVQGIIVFASPNAYLIVEESRVPVLMIDNLLDYIKNYENISNIKFTHKELESIGRYILRQTKPE